jgi:polyisoprenoid-binding protein YceI
MRPGALPARLRAALPPRRTALARLGSTLVFGSALATAAGPAAAAGYQIDPGHTQVHWEVVHLGTSTLRARFDKLDGTIVFDAAAKTLQLGIRVDTASVSSGSAGFDKILRGAQLFAAQEHPVAWFVAQRASFEGDVPRQVHGEITLRGVNQPLTLTATRWRCGFNPLFGREVCGGDFEAELKRSEFGMTLALPLVGDTVRLRIAVEAVVIPPAQ